MSLLRRYRKQPDGFEQLLLLVESSTPQKQDHFFRLIEEEDNQWGSLIKVKMLSIDRIFSWPNSDLVDILRDYPIRFLATALKDHEKNYVTKVSSLISAHKREEFLYEIENRTFSTAERYAAQTVFIKKVRELAKAGRIRLEDIDPQLVYRNEAA